MRSTYPFFSLGEILTIKVSVCEACYLSWLSFFYTDFKTHCLILRKKILVTTSLRAV